MSKKPTYKELEKELEKYKQAYKQLFDASPTGIAEMDLTKGRITQANDIICEYTGYSREELIGMSPLDILSDDSKEQYYLRLNELFKVRKDFDRAEYKIKRKDGKEIWGGLYLRYFYKKGKPYKINIVAHDITERKEAETAILENELKYRTLVESSAQGVLIIQDYQIIFANKAFIEMSGYSAKELMSMSPEELMVKVHPEDYDVVWKRHNDRLAGKPVPSFYEMRLIDKSGKTIWVETSASRIEYQGKPAAQGTFIDITGRKAYEEKLQDTEEKFHMLLENAGVPIIFYSSKGEILLLNIIAAKELGGKPNDFIGKTVYEVFPDYADGIMKRINIVIETCSGKVFEDLMIFEGQKRWYVSSFHPVADKFGNITGCQIIAHDITDKKEAEIALIESEEKLRTIFESANDQIVYIGIDGTIIDVNDKVEEVWGYKRAEIIGKNYAELNFMSPKEMEKTETLFDNLYKGNPVQNLELEAMKNDGNTLFIEINARPVKKENETIGFLLVIRDITERKQAQKEKKNLEERLQQAQKLEAVGTLAGGIAHDFNNILTPILGLTEMSIHKLPDGDITKKNLKEVFRAANRARDLVKQILAFGRPSEEDKFPIQLQHIVKDAIKLIRATIPASIDIKTFLDQNCRAVFADPTQMNQLVINLCTNAYQAMQEKGGILKVSLKEKIVETSSDLLHPDMIPGPHIQLEVSDTGHGIEPKILQKIFDPYFSTKQIGDGTGIGLSVVHGIVKSHNGSINVYSEVGKGSSFEVLLPVATMDVKTEPVRTDGTTIPVGNENILLVDDEYAIVQMMQDTLEHFGYNVTPRTSSVEALEAFKAQPDKFDMIITDQAMPNMTGVVLSRKILDIRPDIPIIICTGFSEQIDEIGAQQLGIKGYLMKPVTPKEFAIKIRQILDPAFKTVIK